MSSISAMRAAITATITVMVRGRLATAAHAFGGITPLSTRANLFAD